MNQRHHPFRRGSLNWLLPFALLFCLGTPGLAPGAARAAPARHSQAGANSAGQVTIIVLDMSGSMGQNDPQGIRCSAADSYIDLSGPNDFIGVVGLDNARGTTGGARGFDLADWQIAPQQMDTKAHRQALRDAIQAQSHGCRPDGNTPTYDALAKAGAMLETATKGGTLSGSLILLTDGQPQPNPQGQIAAINQDLLPTFKQHGWQIDSVALGEDQGGFHAFLNDLSSATSGTFNDDAHGEIAGVSPLNITPFFLQIFALRNNRTPKSDIPPTPLGGSPVFRDIEVGQYISHLDIVAVKDHQNTQVVLSAPDGEVFPPATTGVFISTDPYYAIFSIDSPLPGTWTLKVNGSGLFLVNSLKVSTIALTITAPGSQAVQALGEQFTISAQLSSQGAPISGGKFNVTGKISYAAGSAGAAYNQDVILSDTTGVGKYSAVVTVPTAAPSGSYLITVKASSASDDIVQAQVSVRMDLFPTALLLGANGQATQNTVTANVKQWNVILQTIYGLPSNSHLPVISWLGQVPFAGQLPSQDAVVAGQVFLKNPQTGADKPYANASITAVAHLENSSAPVAVRVENDGGGKFHLIFPVASAGTYEVTITTQGEFSNVHGDLTHVTRVVVVTLGAPTVAEQVRAWTITGVYVLILIFLILLARYLLSPRPFGVLAGRHGEEPFRRWRWNGFFRPSSISSSRVGLEPGLRFYFSRGGRIAVKGEGPESQDYRLSDQPVPTNRRIPANEAQLRTPDNIIYTIRPTGEEHEPGDGEPRASILKQSARFIWSRREDDDDQF